MKRKHGLMMLAIVTVMLLSFTGCGTMAGWVGIASKTYVDEQLMAAQEEAAKNSSEIKAVQSKINEFQNTADQLEGLISSVEETVQATAELKALADILEQRLVNLPNETIRQLVSILDQYLGTIEE